MHRNGLLKGQKFNGRHTTVIEAAMPFVEMLRDAPNVEKIALGIIKPANSGGRGGKTRIKATALLGAVRIIFRGGNSIQQFYVFGTDLQEIVRLVENYKCLETSYACDFD